MNLRPLYCALLLVATASAQALPAFPGAEGGGAESVGGRGGAICEVTNLTDAVPAKSGSLRACTDAAGPRIVVFRVGGTIPLVKDIVIRNPYITIAGQTAPGGGITLSGVNSPNDVFAVTSHNVVVRYIRFRKGNNTITPPNAGDGISIAGGHNIIFDHCSVSWAMDENVSAWGGSKFPLPSNVTLSWNRLAQGLGPHRNFLTGAASSTLADAMVNIDVHHSLFSNSYERNPLANNKTFRLVNNIIYNWRRSATRLGGGVSLDAIGNLYKAGPLNGTYDPKSVYEIQEYPTADSTTPSGSPSIYVVGNIGPHNANPNNDNWLMVRQVASAGGVTEGQSGPPDAQYRRHSPLPALPVPITIHPASQIESIILPVVGASRRLDCTGNWISNRDAVDKRIINEYNTNQGTLPATEADVGGFPTIANGTPCADTDHDGMPDAWEDANGLDKNNSVDGRAIHSSGYSNVERYLNGPAASDPLRELLPPVNVRISN